MKDGATVRDLPLPLVLLLCWLAAVAWPAAPFAQERAGFTAVQAEQGAVIYERSCSSCHGPDLRGSAEAPPLSGASFLAKWRPTMMIELYRVTVQTMPPNRPGSLSEAEALAVDAFILQRNGAVPGARPLSAGAQLRIGVLLDPASASGQPTGGSVVTPADTADDAATAAAAARLTALRAPLARLTPVTDAMLRDPAPDDWLMWRRTYDNWGHSPLTQINRDNVKHLTGAWSWALNSSGMTEFTPLVHDGIMFMWNYGELIQALDARNGNLLWQYRYQMPADYSRNVFYRTKRALAIGGNKLIVPTTDMHLLALDVKTGAVIWDVVTDDARTSRRVYNGGPLVVKGKVIMGASGCAPGIAGCFITAHDLETGKQLWRFNTIAQPGEPGGDTWNNVPAERRWGASVWLPPSYDPELDLLFVGTGSPFPWSSEDRGTYQPAGGGRNGDSLYTSCTLAIDPDTGTLVWYYAHLPNDTVRPGLRLRAVDRAGRLAGPQGEGGDHRRQAGRDRSPERCYRSVSLRGRPWRAEYLHVQSRDGPEDAAAARTARRDQAMPEQRRRTQLPGGLLRSGDQSLLPLGQRHLHRQGRRRRRIGWSAWTSPRASSRWTSGPASCSRPRSSPPPAACSSRRRPTATSAPTTRATARCCGRPGSRTCRAPSPSPTPWTARSTWRWSSAILD